MRNITKNSKAILVLMVIVILALGAGVVGAQGNGGGGNGGGGNGNGGNGNGQGGNGNNDRRGNQVVLQAVLTETGLTSDELRDLRGEGTTLATIIEANGGSVQAVIDTVLAQAETRLSEAVANERITEEQMAERLATLETRVTDMLNGEFRPQPPRNGGNGQGGNGGGIRNQERFIFEAIAEATGLEATEIRQALRDGSTLTELIEANGGDVNAVVASVLASATERINDGVETGRITQERADEIFSTLEQHINDFLNGIRPARNVDETDI